MLQTIIVGMDWRTIGPLLSKDAKNVIPSAIGGDSITSPGSQSLNNKPKTNFAIGDSTMLCGAFAGDDIIIWIKATAERTFTRRNLTLNVIDTVRQTGTEVQMYDCLITEVAFPALNKASTADAVMRLQVKPERFKTTTFGDSRRIPPPPPLRAWGVSDFRFAIDGVEMASAIQTVDSIVFGQKIKMTYQGAGRNPSIESSPNSGFKCRDRPAGPIWRRLSQLVPGSNSRVGRCQPIRKKRKPTILGAQ